MASNKDPYSCNATWWGSDVTRTDMSSTMGNVVLAIFEALPASAQVTLLQNMTNAHQLQKARDMAENK